jgi:hypothetical protein
VNSIVFKLESLQYVNKKYYKTGLTRSHGERGENQNKRIMV